MFNSFLRPGARFLASAFLALCLPALGHSMQLSVIRTNIRQAMRDTGTTSGAQRYTDAQLNGYINIVQGQVNNDTWAVESSTSYTLSPGTTYYALPNNFLGVKRAVFTDVNNNTIQLQEYSEKSVIDTSPNYESDSQGAPTRYFVRQSKSGGTAMQISYLPVPPNVSTGTVRVDYVVQPTDLASDTDIPFNGLLWLTPYHDVIVAGVVIRLKLIEGETDEAKEYMQIFTAEEQQMIGGSQNMPNFKPAASAGGGNH